MATRNLFKWNGQPLGFLEDGALFSSDHKHLGWLEDDGSVWAPDGQYIGELVDDEYVLRNMLERAPERRPLRITPRIPPAPAFVAREARVPRRGWRDPFDPSDVRTC